MASSIPSKKNILDSLLLFLLLLFPPVLYFSYFPLFSLGEADNFNLELSLPLILLALFSLLSLPKASIFIKNNFKKSLPLLLFPLYATLSLLWTENFPRAFLTAGILWCIIITLISSYILIKSLRKKSDREIFFSKLFFLYLLSTSLVCIFCWVQCVLDIAGLPREMTLLCRGCTSTSFGFPHPSGFAIEPQFMGNLLLLPSLIYIYLLIKSPFSNNPNSSNILNNSNTPKNSKSLVKLSNTQKNLFYFSAFLCLSTLFLTFSRGAIYSFALALLLLLILEIKKSKTAKPLLILFPVLISFLISLVSQGLMAEFSYTSDTFASGIEKSISQLSLGLIDLNLTKETSPVENSVENSEEGNYSHSDTNIPSNSTSLPAPSLPSTPSASHLPSAHTEPPDSVFDGYVEESTSERLLLTDLAIKSWLSSFPSAIFGFGLGSSGVIINRFFPDIVDSKEIIQNELFAILLELGLLGLFLLVPLAIISLKTIKKSPHSSLFSSVILAYLVSLMFFSGLPNALHIYLLPAIFFFAGRFSSNFLPSRFFLIENQLIKGKISN